REEGTEKLEVAADAALRQHRVAGACAEDLHVPGDLAAGVEGDLADVVDVQRPVQGGPARHLDAVGPAPVEVDEHVPADAERARTAQGDVGRRPPAEDGQIPGDGAVFHGHVLGAGGQPDVQVPGQGEATQIHVQVVTVAGAARQGYLHA